ncbi:hypothetical protein COY32_00540 [candidate division WWE3 bacterium CG_4_10_14_0_2_um_filter_41_14]|uniref:Nudix hydrolase domain-containing protein n=1 Tax=candidate division WWE3 bacterium CG_4_10_14_0_2_um_filter_41_14 TaxID=1975072 RepID=A0A2M7TLS5_UNCKA|nr:MAG: hypothetical protein COY32_00540 [candidate division WWE3 bacterium CG_4_10_14_0_2_um_filter_41_14]
MRRAILCFLYQDDKVLLLHTEYPDKLVWNGVSGYIDEDETNLEAACREVMEEIGVTINTDNLEYLGTHEPFDIYKVGRWDGEPTPQEPDIKEVKWFEIDALPFGEMHQGNEAWLPEFLNTI